MGDETNERMRIVGYLYCASLRVTAHYWYASTNS